MELNIEDTSKAPPVSEIDMPEDVHVNVARKVDAIYNAIGACVIYGISYAGEDSVQLYIPPEQASYPNYPA